MLELLTQIDRRTEAISKWLPPVDSAPTGAPPALADWLPAASPGYNWTWRHIVHVRQALDQVTAGAIRRLIIQLPPRHGKSQLTTVRYPVYRLEVDPHLRVIVGAYNQTLAEKFSRDARRIARMRPALHLSDQRQTAGDWETAQGGGLRAVGVGAGVTGHGANLIIIDDPVKNREEAESQTYRDRVWDWFTNDLYTRLEPDGAIVVIMTRWHQDDLVGRILASDTASEWTVINLPAEAEADDPLGRAPGEALCPDRFPLEALAQIHLVLGLDYQALYQQRPQPREGGMFKDFWFRLVEAVPARARRVRWWDMAATDGAGDWTVGVLVAEAGRLYYIEDMVRGQWASGERDAKIRATAERDRERYGVVTYWAGQEPGSAGKDAAANFVKLLVGFDVHTEPETGKKEVRAGPLAAQAGAGQTGPGNVLVLRAPWSTTVINELCNFPSGAHDDIVDAAAGAFNKLALAYSLPMPAKQETQPSRWNVGQTNDDGNGEGSRWKRY